MNNSFDSMEMILGSLDYFISKIPFFHKKIRLVLLDLCNNRIKLGIQVKNQYLILNLAKNHQFYSI